MQCVFFPKEKIHNYNSLLNESTVVFSKKTDSVTLVNFAIMFLEWPVSILTCPSPRLLHQSTLYSDVILLFPSSRRQACGFRSGSPRHLFTFMQPNRSYSHFSTQRSQTWGNSLALSPQPPLDQGQDQSRDGEDQIIEWGRRVKKENVQQGNGGSHL